MSTPALIVVKFGDCNVSFRRHWGGDPVIAGSEMLDHLASAEAIKPQKHFHTGSWLLRLMFADGYERGQSLPTYEAYEIENGAYGDWDVVYQFMCNPDGDWRIGLVDSCFGAPWSEIASKAKWFNQVEFRAFIDRKFSDDQAKGVTYDIQLREAILDSLNRHKES
jgi:hypothetical protein